jgi:ribosomal protein S18 acetylase RimI-like enzyme
MRGDRAAARRFLVFAEESRLRLDGIWCRFDDAGRIRDTVLAAVGPGRTATIFASPARRPSEVPGIARLVGAALAGLPSLGVAMGQALVDPREPLQIETLRRGGMRRLADLAYLELALPLARAARDEPIALPSAFVAEVWNPSERAMLASLLERTYVDTLDCPELAGLRRSEDILEGHLNSGRFEPELWTILRFADGSRAGEPAGVCLMNSTIPSPRLGGGPGSIELVYLGLVPEARGAGAGGALLRRSLALLAGRPERSVVLAVDERNAPALALYRRAGFRPTLRRVAFIAPLSR